MHAAAQSVASCCFINVYRIVSLSIHCYSLYISSQFLKLYVANFANKVFGGNVDKITNTIIPIILYIPFNSVHGAISNAAKISLISLYNISQYCTFHLWNLYTYLHI